MDIFGLLYGFYKSKKRPNIAVQAFFSINL